MFESSNELQLALALEKLETCFARSSNVRGATCPASTTPEVVTSIVVFCACRARLNSKVHHLR
eukprot:CAMPEP_0171083224 /NCGR_PEP_ID=MMETSP0766_2-20121228/17589_1 /TAXON_ID=439317 /ORGANISM="Gambierdiscus australes, Strain CAWD 149" /LENGTH=62 /DNA_ID=CAMNT_0011540647 /DNA_START=129 /DNA_END=314 /DNA_ORIENTATION=+